MTALGVRQQAALEHLAAHPWLTEPELRKAVRAADLGYSLRQLELRGKAVRKVMPGPGRTGTISRWALPGEKAPVPAAVPPSADLRAKRARDRESQQRRRAAQRAAAGAVSPSLAARQRVQDLLEASPGMTATEIAAALELRNRPSVMLERMEAAGLLVRKDGQVRGRRCRLWYPAPPGTEPAGPGPVERARQAAARRRHAREKSAREAGGRVARLDGPACISADPEIFFPGPYDKAEPGARWAQAPRAVCSGCPVRLPCLYGAIARGEPFGVWGGQVFDMGRPAAAAPALAG